MIVYNGKIYLPEKHFPWTLQRTNEWNYKRAFMYIDEMKKLQKKNYYPYTEENKIIVFDLNTRIDINT